MTPSFYDAEEFQVPPGWVLVTLHGGTHHGTRYWAYHPPKRFVITESGSEYARHPDREDAYVAVGEYVDVTPDLGHEQPSLL